MKDHEDCLLERGDTAHDNHSRGGNGVHYRYHHSWTESETRKCGADHRHHQWAIATVCIQLCAVHVLWCEHQRFNRFERVQRMLLSEYCTEDCSNAVYYSKRRSMPNPNESS